MPNKFRITFDVDLGKIAPEVLSEGADAEATAQMAVTGMLLAFARKQAIREMQAVGRRSDLAANEKTKLMARQLKRAKLALQAEANLSVDCLPDDAVIRDDTPEREALAA